MNDQTPPPDTPDARHAAPGPVTETVALLADASKGERLCVEDILTAFGGKAFLPLMMVPALLVVSPLSGIPLFSSLCGIVIVIISAQLIARRNRLWVPRFVSRRSVPGDKARAALDRIGSFARWLDRNAGGHLPALVRTPVRQIIPFLCLICGALMPVLEIVPFSSSILGLAVLLMATGLLARDGIFVLLGASIMGTALALAVVAASRLEAAIAG